MGLKNELMVQVFASYNSRYFAVRQNENIRLYRIPAMLWSRDFPGLQEVIQVDDRGDVLFRDSQGLCRIGSAMYAEPESVVWEAQLRGYRPSGWLGRVAFNNAGTQMIGEIVTAESSLSDGFWRLFRRSEEDNAESRFKGYELVLLGEDNNRIRAFPRKYIDSHDGSRFLWSVSPDFRYLAMITCVKRREGVVDIYRLEREGKWFSFVVRDAEVLEAEVDDRGRVSIMTRVAGKRRLIVQEAGKPMLSVDLPDGVMLLHVWQQKVCWMSREALVVGDLKGNVLVSAPLAPLKELGIDYRFFFNYMHEIDLVTVVGQDVYLTRIDPDHLSIDAKRWEHVARYKREITEEKATKAKRDEEEAVQNQRDQEKLSQELASSLRESAMKSNQVEVAQERSAAVAESESVRTRAAVVAEIKSNRADFFAGAISREAYLQRLGELNQEMLSIAKG